MARARKEVRQGLKEQKGSEGIHRSGKLNEAISLESYKPYHLSFVDLVEHLPVCPTVLR